ncbi:MAG: Hsp70 family protein [Candidatus Anammoxibacter sp.]
METIIGIDLGTTNSSVSSLVDGKPEIINIDGSPAMPSCVGIDNVGNLLVGQVAINQFVSAPESTILSIKRNMGEEKKVSLGEKEFTPEEISSFILRKLKDCAKEHLGEDVKKAVITVPAYFNDRQRKATQDAGVLAGLDVVRIINEPTAAAIAYEANKADNEKMLVYDLGGGTFDVSLVVVEDGVVEVKASHGDTRLGGDDFDKLLVDHVISNFQKQHNVDLNKDLRAGCRLKMAMEKAKRELSDRPFVKVREEYIINDLHLEIEIARNEYEDMIRPYLQKTIDCMHQCLRDASMLPTAIDKVMLVGGSTRTPLVYEMLKDAMKIEPRFEINPDLIVAMGAGIQGGIINGLDTHSVLIDITPYTFGTSVAGEFENEMRHDIFVPVIPRNTPIPVSKSKVFFTMFENQKVVEVNIYQGEEPLVGDNVFIGNFIIEGLSKAPEHNPITLNLELDVNGMLKVTAAEKVTGLEKSVVMDTKNVEDKFDMNEARQNIRSIGQVDGDEEMEDVKVDDVSGDPESAPLLKKTEDLRIRAENLLDSSIDEDDAEEIKELLVKIDDAVKKKELETLSVLNESLSDMVFYMED